MADKKSWVIDALEDFVAQAPRWFDAKRGEDYGKDLIAEVLKLEALAALVDGLVEALEKAQPYLVGLGKRDSYSDPDIGLSNTEMLIKETLADARRVQEENK